MRLPVFLILLLAHALPASAQETWCTDNPSNCNGSDPLQSETYTRVGFGAPNYGCWLGDAANSHQIVMDAGITACTTQEMSFFADNGQNFTNNFAISSDSTVLSLLPNRDVSKTARFVRSTDGYSGVRRFGGHATLGTTIKRIATRWYQYVTPTYDFAFEASCTNGKIAHIGNTNFGSNPFLTFQSYVDHLSMYSFYGPGTGWTFPGHTTFEGFNGVPIPGGSGNSVFDIGDTKGKWYRWEIVVRRPRSADAQVSGWDTQVFAKNVTDDTAEQEVLRFSGGCTGCISYNGGPNETFTWNTGIYPDTNTDTIHTEFYRAGTCRGYLGWMYVVQAMWTTDAGQRIGAASEVEGGGGGPPPPNNFRVIGSIGWLIIGTIMLGVGGFYANRLQGYFARYRAWAGACVGSASADDARG